MTPEQISVFIKDVAGIPAQDQLGIIMALRDHAIQKAEEEHVLAQEILSSKKNTLDQLKDLK